MLRHVKARQLLLLGSTQPHRGLENAEQDKAGPQAPDEHYTDVHELREQLPNVADDQALDVTVAAIGEDTDRQQPP